MQIRNLTGVDVSIVVVGDDGEPKVVRTFVAIDPAARCDVLSDTFSVTDNCRFDGEAVIPITRKRFGDIEGLPLPANGILFLVDLHVAEAAKQLGRNDILYLDNKDAHYKDGWLDPNEPLLGWFSLTLV